MTLLTLLKPAAGGGGGGFEQVATPTVLHGPESTAVRPWTSPTLNPAGGALIMVVVSNTGSVSDTASKNASDATSTFAIEGTWGLHQKADPGATAQTSTHVWYAVTADTPGSGTITIATGASPAAGHITVIQIANGFDPANPISGVVSAFDTTGSITHTLGKTPIAEDMALTFTTSRNDANGATAGSGMTLLTNAFHANPSAGQSIQHRTASTSTSAPVAGLNTVHNSSLAFVVNALEVAGGESHSGSLNLTGSGSLTFAGTPAMTGTLALSGSGSLTPSGTLVGTSGTLALTGSGSLTLLGAPQVPGALALTGSGDLSLVGMKVVLGTLDLTGSGALTLAGIPKPIQTLALTGSGALSFTRGPIGTAGTLALTGSGSLTSAATVAVAGTLALSGSGALTSTGKPGPIQTLALTGSGTLGLLQSAMSARGTLALTGSGDLNLSAPGQFSGTLPLTGSGTLTSAGLPGMRGTLGLTGSGALTFAPVVGFTRTLNLSGTGTLSAVAAAVGLAGTLALSGSGQLAFAPRVGLLGVLGLTGGGGLTFTPVAGVAGGLLLTGSGLLELIGFANIVVVVVPDRRTLAALRRVNTLLPASEESTLRSLGPLTLVP